MLELKVPARGMKSEANQTKTKAIRYIIGASILLLTLILFSELSCSILGVCSSRLPFAHIFGFWEMMGISTAILFATLAIHSLRRNRVSKAQREGASGSGIANESFTEQAINHSPLSQQLSYRQTNGWRYLFEQLTDEEKKHMKILMEEHCFKRTTSNR